MLVRIFLQPAHPSLNTQNNQPQARWQKLLPTAVLIQADLDELLSLSLLLAHMLQLLLMKLQLSCLELSLLLLQGQSIFSVKYLRFFRSLRLIEKRSSVHRLSACVTATDMVISHILQLLLLVSLAFKSLGVCVHLYCCGIMHPSRKVFCANIFCCFACC